MELLMAKKIKVKGCRNCGMSKCGCKGGCK